MQIARVPGPGARSAPGNLRPPENPDFSIPRLDRIAPAGILTELIRVKDRNLFVAKVNQHTSPLARWIGTRCKKGKTINLKLVDKT